LAAVFARAGFWQLDRARQRDAVAQEISAAAERPPLELNTPTSASQLHAWRPVVASGKWLHAYTVLIGNRNHEGQPGYWVATPLALSEDQHMTVLRGWLPRERVMDNDPSRPNQVRKALLDELAEDKATQTIEGELFPHVPRVFELWSWGAQDDMALPDSLNDTRDAPVIVQNLAQEDYAYATGLHLLPMVVARHNGTDHGLIQEWEHPSTDAATNKGYALQWFGFFTIAAGAWVALFWRGLRTSFKKDGK